MAGAAVALALLIPTDALAQSRTFYDASGRVTGRSITGSGGSTTIYGADGRVTGRTSTSGNHDDDLRQRWSPHRHCHDNQAGQMNMMQDTTPHRLRSSGFCVR